VTDQTRATERLRDAICGERRHWHVVSVRPDDLAALLDEAEARASLDVDVVKLQWAMRRAHGRRISLTETYAEAIARVYNGDEYRAILDPQP
jgi:hypothetical protein